LKLPSEEVTSNIEHGTKNQGCLDVGPYLVGSLQVREEEGRTL